ncbi:bifunctional diaminohydroxyphosphoribosylaminopyrimidine deaminase/5-amino-6-(5-phosphoribosylamino)uracil reductase RibD [Desulfoferrobacter suflitae]|uniref:bifunctional diaminohydroxyphosphoribosylaminopyrimidine deaminase/5-amino-6-(5-phosphoribosylamino)uracil reductase RibD n=1 Tax=Desulfoferrobacter suflitae TaxID=2865782 RepID=UPI0021646D3D|nr:bifunctional diaminohydroxyphosphoribosylaminopyrimidine deaminase/5-amino-6-(5-phosphoribosylamino)uracil reductase RibD [Desulfoferrobacter suflitae]MCK8601925.1 bifunctional diaminohydroxyphosphoribosylaminopyrimidine deaminase/5-amino-6-(5-phosphoribosylamino)uracil reductase RibD [Desulfoferrobacter suflitae]
MLHDDEFYMKEALRWAAKGRGRTSPNPLVGAVVVADGAVVGKGCHEYVGGPHAEINALRDAADKARGAVLYVTLEPCNHFGRTPPCSQAVLQAGIARVVIGMEDPNRQVKGGGADYLRRHGVTVDAGILHNECRKLNQRFIKYATTGIPYVTLKAAMTLDGKIATRTGDARWVSNESSRRFAHRLRCELDAILVGIGTALCDDPMLTARLGKKTARQPIRIVLDAELRIPLDSQLVLTAREFPVWIACGPDAAESRMNRLHRKGVRTLRLPAKDGRIDLAALLEELGGEQITSLLVEGGAHVLGSFLEQHLADDFYFFYGPKILADPRGLPAFWGNAREMMSQAFSAYDIKVRRFGQDVMLTGRFREAIY